MNDPATGKAPAPAPGAGRAPSRLADLLVAGLAAVYLVLLARQAGAASFASDECFHAYLAEWIAGHGWLPRELTAFYSGLPYFYPPLLHVIGAGVVQVAGPDALRYLNVWLTGLLFAAILTLPLPGVPRAARRWTVLLCMANASLSLYAVRFYAEALATLLAVVVVMLLLWLRARPGPWRAVVLGIAVALALLAKQPALLLPVLLAVLAVIDRLRGRRALAGAMLVALATGLALALPFFVRNAVLFGSPLYPPLVDDAQVALEAMNTRLFSLPPAAFYRSAAVVMGPLVPWLAVAALAGRALRGRFDLVTGLLAGCVAFVLLGPLVRLLQPRHLNPVTATAALLASLALLDGLRGRRWLPPAAEGLLAAWVVLSLVRMPQLRAGLDTTAAGHEAYRAIAAQVPPGATVLTRATYDTFYYARRNATWPIPWGKSAGQLALFTERDPDRFLATLEGLPIDYLVAPRRGQARPFNGANHPQPFVACVATLVERGRLRVLWGSDELVLVGRAE